MISNNGMDFVLTRYLLDICGQPLLMHKYTTSGDHPLFAYWCCAGIQSCEKVNNRGDTILVKVCPLSNHPVHGLGPGALVLLSQGSTDSLGVMSGIACTHNHAGRLALGL
jgi:hypothetical protein